MKRILFVDDEIKVLDGIRRMLFAERDRWEMHFAQNAEQALEACDRGSFDVVISDMRMPGMDGAALLARIRTRFPETARIVLSGYSEVSVAMRTASDAHRFLAKPCKPSELKETIERVLALRELVASPEIRRVVGGIGQLPSLSTTYVSLTEAVKDPNTSIGQLTAIIERDVAMAAKVLQLTNSAFFGLPQHITNLACAVSYLGMGTIKSLALASEVFRVFKPGPGIRISVCDSMQHHALQVATIAGALPIPSPLRDHALIAGLLHDIGKLFLASTMQDDYCAVAAKVSACGCPWFEAEREILGACHAEIGAYLLGLWGIPELAVEAIAHHHNPCRIPHSSFDCTEALFVANLLAHELKCESETLASGEFREDDRETLERLGLLPQMKEFRELAAESLSRQNGNFKVCVPS